MAFRLELGVSLKCMEYSRILYLDEVLYIALIFFIKKKYQPLKTTFDI
jgi:hypothetical protein